MINIYFYTSSRGRREFVRAKVTRKNAALISLKTKLFPSFPVTTNPINNIELIELSYKIIDIFNLTFRDASNETISIVKY